MKSRLINLYQVILIALFCPLSLFGSPDLKKEAVDQIAQLNLRYKKDVLTKEDYMRTVDSLAQAFLSKGIEFEPIEFVELLKVYETIAWGDKKYEQKRLDYYIILLNNARTFDYRGASVYYAEKANQEYLNSKKENSWIELGQKLFIYAGQLNHNKIVSTYSREEKYILRLPVRLRARETSKRQGLDALYVLSPAIMAFASQKDTAGVYRTAYAAADIIRALRTYKPLQRGDQLMLDFFGYEFDHAIACFQKDYKRAQQILFQIEGLKSAYPDLPTGFLDLNLIEWRTGLFMELKNIDSASYYLKKFEELPGYSQTQEATIYRYKAQLNKLKGDYLQSNIYLEKALAEQDTVNSFLIGEMDSLLYAYTLAEHNKLSLEKSERAKHQRTIWIIVISVFSLSASTCYYIFMRRRTRRSNNMIQSLRNSASIQLALMNEARDQAIRDEKRRLSQHLHDNLSGLLASVHNRINLLSLDTSSHAAMENIEQMKILIQKSYQEVRLQSHELHNISLIIDEQRFARHIEDLTKAAFPNQQYTFMVNIDDEALSGSSFELRENIIRILQETFTNIIKHAQADHVDLLLYKDGESLMLDIQDNGQGFKKTSKKNGIGLKNIEDRVRRLAGKMEISSNTNGTLFKFSFPMESD